MPIKIVPNIIQCKYKQIMNKIQHFPRKSGENRQGIFLFLGGGQDSFFLLFFGFCPRFFVPPLFCDFQVGVFLFLLLFGFGNTFYIGKNCTVTKKKSYGILKSNKNRKGDLYAHNERNPGATAAKARPLALLLWLWYVSFTYRRHHPALALYSLFSGVFQYLLQGCHHRFALFPLPNTRMHPLFRLPPAKANRRSK